MLGALTIRKKNRMEQLSKARAAFLNLRLPSHVTIKDEPKGFFGKIKKGTPRIR